MWALESRRGLGIEGRTRDRPFDGERVIVIAVERDRGLVDVYGTPRAAVLRRPEWAAREPKPTRRRKRD